MKDSMLPSGTAGVPPARAFCLGTRSRDLTACAVLAVLVLAGAPLLAVYYRATATEVAVVRIDPGGRRTPVPVPRSFWRDGLRTRVIRARPAEAMGILQQRIETIMRGHRDFARAHPGTQYEWTIRYSDSHPRLDRRAVHVHPAPGDDQD